MDDPERWLQSDSEEEEGADFDPYQCDPQFENEKSRIRETLNLSTNAMKRNKKIIGDIHFFCPKGGPKKGGGSIRLFLPWP